MVGHHVGAAVKTGVGLALFAFLAASAGCSSSRDAAGSSAAPIQNGTNDSGHPFAVGVCVGGPNNCQEICSGALIAPNLVMTARHCVNSTPSAIDCSTASFGAQPYSTSNYWITTDYTMWQVSKGWHQAAHIYTTPGSLVCGNDMALIELKDDVSSSEVSTLVTPVVQYSIGDTSRYSTTVTAIGYGINTPADMSGSSAGYRRIKQNINLTCIPNDPALDCGSLMGVLTANEFVSGDGTCEGDSGSSAYEQKNFNMSTPVSFGVLSRGGVDTQTQTCVGGIYTRTDAWKDFIINTAKSAAADGGYPPPSWTQPPPPPPPDGGMPPPPGQGQLGDACSNNTDCASKLCESQDGSSYTCTQTCDASNPCPTGYACAASGNANYCFPQAPSTDGGGGGGGSHEIVITKSGCSVSPTAADPTKPVPWRLGALAAVVGLAIARRRRARSAT